MIYAKVAIGMMSLNQSLVLKSFLQMLLAKCQKHLAPLPASKMDS